jgi:hypothetical protein
LDPLVIIGAVREHALDTRIDSAGGAQQRPAAVAILNARGMRLDQQRASVRVDQGVALAAVDLLAGVVTARTAGPAISWPGAFSQARYDPANGNC